MSADTDLIREALILGETRPGTTAREKKHAALAALGRVDQVLEAAELVAAYDQAGGNEWWAAHAKLYRALAAIGSQSPAALSSAAGSGEMA